MLFGFSWVEGANESKSDRGSDSRTWRLGCVDREMTADNGGIAYQVLFRAG